MNNDLRNNHSSMSSNKYIANRRFPELNKYYQESYIKERGMLDTKSRGNKTIFFDSDNDNRPSNQKDLLISKSISKYPTNYAAGPIQYNDNDIQGYLVNNYDDPRFNNHEYKIPTRPSRQRINDEEYVPRNRNDYRQNIENGGDEFDEQGNDGEDEEEMENGNEYDNNSPSMAGNYNRYIGDGIVRNNLPNYSPNQNGQSVPYYRKKYFPNNNYNNNYGQIDEYQNENEEGEGEEEEYIEESPEKQYNNNAYNYNRQPYKRHIFGNPIDSASSEAYANKNNVKSPNSDNSSIIYQKPKSKYINNYNNLKNGISTEERGIESKESPNNVDNNGPYYKKSYIYNDTDDNELNKYNNKINYDEDSVNVVGPPIYNYQNNEKMKGGKIKTTNTISLLL